MRVRRPGSRRFVTLTAADAVPLGSTINVKAGVLALSAVPKPAAAAQTATFYAGIFKVTQPGSVTQLALTETLRPCKGRRAAAAANKPKTRKLWGNGSGSFRTRGAYSSATVRGTKWVVQDSCAGTLTRVTRGVVTVRDNVRHKTITVRAAALLRQGAHLSRQAAPLRITSPGAARRPRRPSAHANRAGKRSSSPKTPSLVRSASEPRLGEARSG